MTSPLHHQLASHLVPPHRPVAAPCASDWHPASGGSPCSSSPSSPLPLPASDRATQAPPFHVPTLAEAPCMPRPSLSLEKRHGEQTPGKPYTELRSALGVAWGSPQPARSREVVSRQQEQTPGALRGARMRAGAEASGAPPQQPTLRASETHHGHRGRSQDGTFHRHVGAQHQPRLSAPPVPCIYSFNNNKSHLFIPCRKETSFYPPLSGAFCGLASTCPSRWAVAVVCPHVSTRRSLCGSLHLPFPGDSALGS